MDFPLLFKVSSNNMKRQPINIILIIVSTILLFACEQKSNKEKNNSQSKVVKHSGELLEINFSDSSYFDLEIWIKDTITKAGYEIKYLVRDDSTKYNDIYIQCSKGNLSGTFHGENLLQYRRYFIPKFIGETNKHIYFSHGCATDCSALLVFPKDTLSNFIEFFHVVDFNIEFEQVLFVTDSTYENENKIYDLALVDLKKNKTHKITYNNICGAVIKPTCIDTVIFKKSQVTIKTTLRKSIDTEQEIVQTKIIKL
jgi:hypothetical protein